MTVTTNAAPGQLELVRSFVNTNDIDAGSDAFATPAALGGWLLERGLVEDPRLGRDDLARAVALREALRDLADPRAGHGAAAAALTEVAAACPLTVAVDAAGRARLEPASGGVDGALGKLVAVTYAAMLEGTWSRLKACANDACRWLFYDRSRNRSGRWCTMRLCGNQANARAYRRRRADPVRELS